MDNEVYDKSNVITSPEDTKGYDEDEREEEEKGWLLLTYRICVLAAIVVIILLAWFRHCNCDCCHGSQETQPTTVSQIDDNISDGSVTNKTSVEDLNKKVEEGMITMSMNTDPVFENGKAKGNLLIENDTSNNYPITVQIFTKKDNQLIYKSGKIPIGKFVNYAPLEVNLPKGTYECVAYFNNVDDNTGEVLGTGGSEITVHVLN